VTDITTTYQSNSEDFVLDYTADSHFFKIFIGTPSTSETIDLKAVATYATDRPDDCDCLAVVVVTDDTGATLSTDATFSVSDFVLTIATDAPVHESIFLKATTYVDTVFQVDKVLVTVCGDQTIVNIDETNPVFDINGNATDVPEWTVFSLKDIWKTTSPTFPDNECPVTNVEICEDD